MANIQKGKISAFGEQDNNGNYKTASVINTLSANSITRQLVIPKNLRGKTANLEINTDVIYVVFDDTTGIILGRADGESTNYFYGDLEVEQQIKAQSAEINGINMENHTHSVINSQTSTPK